MLSDKAEAGGGVSPWRAAGWGLALLLLLALAVMQVTDEVRWTFSGFVFAAFLIGGVGLGLELAVRARGSRLPRRHGRAVADRGPAGVDRRGGRDHRQRGRSA